jgi:hypothetical protein
VLTQTIMSLVFLNALSAFFALPIATGLGDREIKASIANSRRLRPHRGRRSRSYRFNSKANVRSRAAAPAA